MYFGDIINFLRKEKNKIMVTNISDKCISLIAYYECSGEPDNPKWLKAYLDSGGVWTIGIGTIKYPNGQKVKKGDVINRTQMYEYFNHELRQKIDNVNFYTRDDIQQHELDSLVSIAYNIGTTGLQKSTLLKNINEKKSTSSIIMNFLQWRFDNGKEVSGLLKRRMSEAYLFATGKLKYDWINYKSYSAKSVNEVINAVSS